MDGQASPILPQLIELAAGTINIGGILKTNFLDKRPRLFHMTKQQAGLC